ncbi:mechanosensitive ion channel family protein [uncultured Desulfosarcina sp.]|uniref:mechanosensitive ion channel family protein n=1 Tax=uncultured Desulfosarcina sp. TaxID=218289 RepID=UPI0029C61B63|nr:mechanosensitive ion channel family protein [uncultured Desulfosarcina sp.]
MDTITIYIDRVISFFGTEASLSKSWANALLTLLAALILWLVIKRILATLGNKVGHFKLIQVRKELFVILQKSTGLLLIWLVGVMWIRLFHLSVVEKMFHAVFIIVAATPVKSLLLILLEYLERNLAKRTETAIDNIVIDLLNKFSGAIVYATAAVIALDVLGVNVMPFIAGAGVMGVAVGFAAKDTLSNLIAGILLIIDRPFEIGDRIEVWSAPAGSASWGDVIDIGLRATRIKTTDNIVVIIPNNEIMTRDIVNYTIISSSIRVRVNIGIAYDADMVKAKALIVQAAQSADWILPEPAPKVVVRDFGESSVSLQLRVWIKDARKRMDTISYITDTVKTLFDENGIEIPFPKRDITIVDRHAGKPFRQKKEDEAP